MTDSTAPDDATDDLVGTIVDGKYRIRHCIGRGGMGAVYEAVNEGIGKRVALKFLFAHEAQDRDSVQRFQREALAASAVESAHIVQIFDSGTTSDGRPYLVMELLKGEDLRARLQRSARIPVAEAVHIAGQTLRGLVRAHEAGIIHRDLKPDNVFLQHRDDDPLFVKLVDFGISKVSKQLSKVNTLTRKGTVLGTAYYMSPEQAQAFDDIDGRADLYSVGAIVFEALAGRPPHTGNAYEAVLINICTKDAPDVRDFAPDVPEPLAHVIARSLKRDRTERFADAAEFYAALTSCQPDSQRMLPPLSGSAPQVPSVSAASDEFKTAEGTAAPTRRSNQTRRTVVAALIAALGAFTLTAVFMAQRGPRKTESTEAAAAPTPTSTPATAEPAQAASASPSASTARPTASPQTESASTPDVPTVRPARKPTGGAGSRPIKATTPTKKAGVAGGLKLNTKEP